MRVLDLFCGQGGAGWGYHLAGCDVTGVDIRPQPRYPAQMTFVHGDALAYLLQYGRQYDLIHASPPCRAYTKSTGGVAWKWVHPDLIGPVRQALHQIGRPYIIENVPNAPLEDPVVLCGAMFGLRMYRHRLFETSFPLRVPEHPEHVTPVAKMGRPAKEGEFLSLVGNFSGLAVAREAIGMPWANQDGVRQAVPPAYTQWIGRQIKEMAA